MKILNLVLAVFVIFGLVFLVSCGTGTQTSGGQGTAQGKDGGINIFANKPVEYKVSYRITTDMGDEGLVTIIEKIASKGNDKLRIELTDEKIKGSTIVYFLGKDAYLCGVENGKESCIKTISPNTEMGINKALESIKDSLRTSTGTRIIAGVTAYCSKVDTKGMNAEACASKEGVPLYLKTVNPGGESLFEAFEYSTTVSDAEFIPGEVTETFNPEDLAREMGGASGNGGNQDLQDFSGEAPSDSEY